MIIKNLHLEKYEIKKPDYRYIERPALKYDNVNYTPLRYKNVGPNRWESIGRFAPDAGNKHIKLMFTGDITCFEKQIHAAQTGPDSFDFEYVFEEMRPIYKQADLVVGNLETMLFANAPYRSEKFVNESNYHCNAPAEFLEAVRLSGMDVVTNANNHDLDTGAVGLGETLDLIEKMGFPHTGTFKTDCKRYEIIDVKGIKIGLAAFACEHNKKDQNLTEEGREFLLHDYKPEKARAVLEAARKDGAELVFICMHWGKENIQTPNEEEIAMAKELAEMGYDCIIGSHPHVLQPFTIVHTKEKDVPVFYSMGNYIAHNLNNPKARSVIACIDIEEKQGKYEISCSYIPIYIAESYKGKPFVVLPIAGDTKDKENQWKLEKIMETMGQELPLNKDIVYQDLADEVLYRESKMDKLKDVKSALPQILANRLAGGDMDGKRKGLSGMLKAADFDDGYFTYKLYGDHAEVTGFSDDASNMSYTVPESIHNIPVTVLREGAFEGNSWVKKINFRKNLPGIPKRVMKNCSSLEGFQCGRSTRVIEEEAFSNCPNLTFAAFNAYVRRIEDRAFAGCENLMSAKIHPNVSYIADSAFEGCKDLTIFGETGSYAEAYAKSHGIPFVHMPLSKDAKRAKLNAQKEGPAGVVVPKAKGLKAEVTEEGILLEWEALNNISKYKLYRRAEGETVFQRIRTTVRLSYLDKTAVSGRYEYKMRAYLEQDGAMVDGAFSEIVAASVGEGTSLPEGFMPNQETVKVTISCVGDVTLGSNQKQEYEGSFHQFYDQEGPEYFFQNVKHIFEESDCSIANFEGVLTTADERRNKRFNHKGRPEYADILKPAGIPCVSLANNHIIDYRKVGAMDTMNYLKNAGIEYAICGDYGVRYVLYSTRNQVLIGLVSVNVLDEDPRNQVWLIEGLEYLRKQGASIVVAAIHWGKDKSHEVLPSQEELGHWCIDQGYDLVVGCHAHVLQGIEAYKGRFIVYNMGNFCYGGHRNPKEKETMIFQQTFTVKAGKIVSGDEAKVIPCQISGHKDYNDYCPVVSHGKEGKLVIDHINAYSSAYHTRFDDQGNYIKKEVEESKPSFMGRLFKKLTK